ncbi:transposase [Prosthecobacter fusiformis]|nr:transposase [Prosthecobacter fusiformis]
MKWIREREAWLLHHPYPWKPEVEREYHERFSQQMERWLDAGHGCCLLRDGEARAVVERTLQHFDDRRYLLHAWVLMPNHAHVLVSIREEWTLPQILHSWKSYSTHALNSLLRRQGALWQEDYFDRLIRDEEHFANCVRYIRRNPEKAHLPENEWSHHETVIARRSLRERK